MTTANRSSATEDLAHRPLADVDPDPGPGRVPAKELAGGGVGVHADQRAGGQRHREQPDVPRAGAQLEHRTGWRRLDELGRPPRLLGGPRAGLEHALVVLDGQPLEVHDARGPADVEVCHAASCCRRSTR